MHAARESLIRARESRSLGLHAACTAQDGVGNKGRRGREPKLGGGAPSWARSWHDEGAHQAPYTYGVGSGIYHLHTIAHPKIFYSTARRPELDTTRARATAVHTIMVRGEW